MTDAIADPIADPIGLMVAAVAAVETEVDPAAVEEVVKAVAGGRAKQRKLAAALAARPGVLTDGRSPAPRAIGDLLIALRRAGATSVSAPVCAECGKHLRTLQRRGDHWYCGVCGPAREPCARCGIVHRVASRDRAGMPRCSRCPPDDVGDPVETIADIVAAIDPGLATAEVIGAVTTAVPASGRRHSLAWTLADRPELLTGAGATAPAGSVLRLIDALIAAGATRIVRPACPGCGRVIKLWRVLEGAWHCRNCVAKSRAVRCSRCSRCPAVREPAARDADGRPLCPYCLVSDPVNLEDCTSCGRRRTVAVRTADGPLCPNCRPIPTMTCSICSRQAPCVISKATGQPWCGACSQRWARCCACGHVCPIGGGTEAAPLCSICVRDDPQFWRTCPGCGLPGRLKAGSCVRCALDQRLREVFSDRDGRIRPPLEPLYQALATTERPGTAAAWLDNGGGPAIIAALDGDAPLTHEALDALPPGKPVEHLRSVLVALGTLPPRDEQMVRLQRWINQVIADRTDPHQQHLLRRYAIWHLLRRLRRRTGDAETTHTQYAIVRQHVRGAITVLNWLTDNDLTLATARQPDLEAWLAGDQATHRREAGHFVRWAAKNKLTTLEFAAVKWNGPTDVIDSDARWDQARRLLHDDTLRAEERVAGLFVLLYAQGPAAISRLRLDHVHTDADQVRISFGTEPIVLPEPLATLVTDVVGTRSGHAVLGDDQTSRWLFPGGQPGRPISSSRLGERLHEIGIRPRQARSTALFGLAAELPAALLARMLGIHISVAVAWQRASSGDWTNYAADVSRRTEAP